MNIELLDQPSTELTVQDRADADDSDANVMWIAISAVASEYGWTTAQATTRLAEVQWTI